MLGCGDESARASATFAVSQLVPGDVVQLAAGEIAPGDFRIVAARSIQGDRGLAGDPSWGWGSPRIWVTLPQKAPALSELAAASGQARRAD